MALGFLDVDRFGISLAGESNSTPFGGVQHPGVPRLSGKEYQLANGHKAPVVFGGPALNGSDLLGKTKGLALDPLFSPAARLIVLRFMPSSKLG